MVHSFIRRYSTRYTRTSFTSIDPCVTLVYRYLRRYFRKYDTIVLPYLFPFFKTTCTIVYSCTFEGTFVHSYIQCCALYGSTKVPSKVLSYFRKYFRTIMILYFRKYVYFHYCTLYTYSTYQFLAKSTIDSANGDMILYVYSCTVHVALRVRSAVRKYGSTKVRLYFHRYVRK